MKGLVAALGGAFLLGFLMLGAAEKPPAITFVSTVKDFGKVTEGEVLKHVFTFSNTGGAELEILKVEPS